ncbi:embryonic protein UVS.2-like isoform X2 [Mytilus galloprovincialis]|uniref:embryonic protein UVS.2-like isoform X2 n=1 Tax=Mytilus galloprovincialis TaxID=29158 RepID=UPI003F7BD267
MEGMLVLLFLVSSCQYSAQIPAVHQEIGSITQRRSVSKQEHGDTSKESLSAMDLIVDANTKSGISDRLLGGDVLPKRLTYFNKIQKRNAVSLSLWEWKNHKIPYIIKESDFSASALSLIKDAIATFNRKVACISWTPRKNEPDFVRIRSGAGCVSSIGRDGGMQDLYLGSNCYYKGVVLHEMNHATGFYHEQSRPDRDKYVQVNWDNIQSDKRLDFKKETQYIDTLGAPYDYGSIMHYGKDTFSANGKPTLIPLFDPKGTMGQRTDLSLVDIWKINKLYKCTGIQPPIPKWMVGLSTLSIPGTTTTEQSLMSTTSAVSSTSSTAATTSNTNCLENLTVPKGLPGRPQQAKVFAFPSALRVSWEPPCTSVEVTGYNLVYWNCWQNISITLPPTKLTHYIGTVLHKGQRYKISMAAITKIGMGPRTEQLSTYSACGNDVFLRGNETYDRIYSPHFSQGYYEPDVACHWTVSVPQGQRLKITFDSVNLGSGLCNYDFLKINGVNYCTPPSKYILSKTDTVTVIFYSTPGDGKKPGGFHLMAEVEDNSPRNISVKTNIPGLFVVTWKPPEDRDQSTYKYRIKYRVYPEIVQQVVTLPSHRTFWPIRTQSHYGRRYEVELMTESNGKDGISKSVLIRTACGGNITVDGPGKITNLPSFGTYERDVICRWNFSGKDGKHLLFMITKLNLEPSSDCQNDFVAIGSAGRFCAQDQNGTTINTGENQMTVLFSSNMEDERTGFELQYNVL